ncbi:DMT family transporter [Salimicrobium halophilum]|uniref:Threonine/homoserine efflux transporter RhtA n=1 Tax=Salimicrobium halophilum TaxID=86666 RepID=A0A1G8VPU6_9BACI|nr:DMT family transporter [Salimicrobium halophilum]SDJ68116.1 Threonine/homoserine efflux transporter RhtA [Salimicrobium halophilum]
MNRPPAAIYAVLAVAILSISASAIFVRLAGDAPAAIIAFYRLGIAVVLMTPWVLLKHRDHLKSITKKDAGFSIMAGIFLAAHFILWFESLKYTSVASSVVLVSLQPIFAFLGTYFFFRERFSAGAVLSMMIAITGSIVLGWGDFQAGGEALYGDILALLGGAMVTGYFLIGQSVRKRLTLSSYTWLVYGMATVTLFLYNLPSPASFLGHSGEQWLIFLALALIPTFLGHSLLNWSLKWVSTSQISMAVLLEPVGASIMAYFLFDEILSWTQLLGGAVVLFGLMIFILSTTRKRKPTLSYSARRRG